MNSRRLASLLVVVLFMVPLVAPFISMPVTKAAEGAITINPVRFTIVGSPGPITPTIVVLNGGSFGSGAEIRLYISSDRVFTTTDTPVEVSTDCSSWSLSFRLGAGERSFRNTVLCIRTTTPLSPGGYFIAATDDNGNTWTEPAEITLTTASVSLTLDPTSLTPFEGATVRFSGGGYTAGSTVYLFLGHPGGRVLAITTADESGNIEGSFTFPIPGIGFLARGTYMIVAQDDALNKGLTVHAPLTINPGIRVEPFAVGTSPGQVITVKGYGFTAGKKVSANTITVGASATTHPEVTIASDGTFTVPNVVISGTLTPGWVTVTATSTAPESASTSLLVSVPGFIVPSLSLFGGATSQDVVVGDKVTVYAFNYPPFTTLKVLIGDVEVGSILTNPLGAGYTTITVPRLPGTVGGLDYIVDAVNYDLGIMATQTITLRLKTSLYVTVAGGLVTRSGTTVTIYGHGAWPQETLTITFTPGVVTPAPLTVTTDASGSFSITRTLRATSAATTGTAVTVTISGTNTGSKSVSNAFRIWRDDLASIVLTPTAATAGTTVSVSVSNLRPLTTYELLWAGSSFVPKITFTTNSFGSATAPLSFTVPNVAQGPYKVSVAVLGTASEDALAYLVVSVPSSVPSFSARLLPAGTPTSTITATVGRTLELYVFGFSNGELIKIYRAGSPTPILATTLGTSGGALLTWTIPDMPSGTYRLFVEGSSAGVIGQYVYLTIRPSLSLDPTSGYVGQLVSFTAKGLRTNTAYSIIFGDVNLGFVGISNSAGTLAGSFEVPEVLEGTYTVKLVLSSDPTKVVATATFRVVPPPGLTVTPNPSAFPGQLVMFEWDTGVPTLVPPVYVTVLLNNTAYTTFPANYIGTKLYGFFQMPNAPPGTTWVLKFAYKDSRQLYYWTNGSTVESTHYPATIPANAVAVWSKADPQSDTSGSVLLKLVKGSGALVMSISDADVARIAGAVNATVYGPIAAIVTSTGDRVLARLSDLDAKIVEVRDGVALLNTRFGEMSASLSAINATLSGLIVNAKGEVLARIDTALGTVLARLDDLDARLVAVHGDTAVIRTMVGEVKLALESLNATIAGIKDDAVVIKTSAGFIKAKVEEFIALLPSIVEFVNATVTDIKSGIAAVKDDTGFIKAKVEDIIELLSAASTTLSEVAGDVSAVRSDIAAVRGDIAEVKALVLAVNDNVGLVGQAVLVVADLNMAVLDRLDEMNATLVGVSGGVAKLSTDVDGLASLVKAANLSISQIVVDQAGRIVATLRDSEGRISGLITTNAKTLSDLITAVGKDVAGVADSVKKVSDTLAAFQSGTFSKLDAISGSVDAARADLARLRTDAAAMASVVAGIQTTVSRVDTNVGGLVDTAKAIATTVDSINRAVPGLATKADVSGAQTAITGAIDRAKSDLQSAVKSAETAASTSSRNWGVINAILIIIAIAILAYSTFVARRA
ncbi:MAG: methyl-accepting chemotaxis protein [Thermosphaera sp.]|nr:methyl-accepting chemotaxis protein [Thermosphaera sp.]